MKKIIFFLLVLFLSISCSPDFLEKKGSSVLNGENEMDELSDETWTFLVYMSADNNLESSAIADINEMESVSIPENSSILVLVDRSPDYDASNGDWNSTRLYEIQQDCNLNRTLISSRQLECEELGLSLNEETELDMGNRNTLSAFMDFAKRKYPARHYGLIIWGHGTGWRGFLPESGEECSKAFALDVSNSNYLSLPALRQGIEDSMKGQKLDFLGFDTCFGVTVEVAVEMKDSAVFMAGTPALETEAGWNYTLLFDYFFQSDMSPASFAECALRQFSETYSDYPYGCFSILKLEAIGPLSEKINSMAKTVADSITCKEERDEIFEVFSSKAVSYMPSSFPGDFYVDLQDVFTLLGFENQTESFEDAVYDSWSASLNLCSMGIYFASCKLRGVYAFSHPESYVNGSREIEKPRFINVVPNYVPSEESNGSLLDKLFYTIFDGGE